MNKDLAAVAIGTGVLVAVVAWLAPQIANYSASNSSASSRPTVSRQLTNGSASTAPVTYQASAVNKSELDLAVGNVAIPMITDSAGRRTGRNSPTGQPLQEIPQSTYYEDSMGDSSTGSPTKEVNHFISITQPQTGRYSIMLTDVQAGDYQLSIRAFSSDGTSQPANVETGHLEKGAQIKFLLDYTSNPGATSSLTRSQD